MFIHDTIMLGSGRRVEVSVRGCDVGYCVNAIRP